VIAWELAGRLLDLLFLPPASEVAQRLLVMIANGEIIPVLGTSLTNLALGLAIALIAGMLVGLLTGTSRRASLALDPFVNALLTAPSLVFAPVFFTIWGVGRESAVALIVMYSVFVVIVNTAAAAQAASANLQEMARSFNATPANAFIHVTLPAATPLILVGIRLAVARGVKGMVNAEMFIAISGLGKLIEDAQAALDATTVIAVLVVAVSIALSLMWCVDRVDKRLTQWLPRTTRS
jgi:NitT/TauT family transport system permease protein